MTTNYGARPGLVMEPRTMSAEVERDIRRRAMPLMRALLAELDAERAAHAETREALAAEVATRGRLVNALADDLSSTRAQLYEALEALAQARGSRGAS